MKPDFTGYATKAGLKCSDGRTIMPDAFAHHDGQKVPLVWQHGHDNPENVLGHAYLKKVGDDLRCEAYFNDTVKGQHAKTLVRHGDVNALSIYANKLVERAKQVFHGKIHEVSLVLSGANPGALIDNVSIQHSDGDTVVLEDEVVIYTGLPIAHADSSDDDSDDDGDGPTVADVMETLTDDQRVAVAHVIDAAVEQATTAEHSDGDPDEDESDEDPESDEDNTDENPEDESLTHQEGHSMSRNVFEDTGSTTKAPTLSHDQLKDIVEDAQKLGSFKEAFLAHADKYGIENIDILFPEARNVDGNTPQLIARRMEWVSKVISGARKSPFSRIKSVSADITHDEARAKGYVKGNLKKEEWFALAKRVTTPTTIYKKQKLDRDDIIDITDLDVVAWLKSEMRLMLDEEIARAVLVGDGREVDDEDKIDETMIRPIARDDDFYNHKVVIPPNAQGNTLVEAILRARPKYRGSGQPSFFTTESVITDLLLAKDKLGRRYYEDEASLARALRVREVVPVEILEDQYNNGSEIMGVMVNMSDYTMGADRGGQVSMFDDFDIDYNQYKYLIEGRMSGALTKFKSAMTFLRGTGTQVTPEEPTFNPDNGVVTIPDVTGVSYFQDGASVDSGPQTAIDEGDTTEVTAAPDTGYYFPGNTQATWEFNRPVG